ncbi:MAG TPA: 4Fe-4S dicluster domain-containing protein [Prolixibacteraceae bacterium]|nr:4Fe-4S dicluster domain-containing protein [Prolixibacteraceae bacterium]HPR84566.1 4Fe-4S dicluster domain-containing protein [Prolixibacteraceae bacterium]
MELYQELTKDVRFEEGLKSCMNCGVCTAICPAAEFYDYDPRLIAGIVQSKDEKRIEELLKSDTIWYCGECMSCKTRCPRGNTPGLIIMALRSLSQELGYFAESEKGRQQLAIKRVIGENIVNKGYCVLPESLVPELHPEQGPVGEWIYENKEEVFARVGANYNGEGEGALRKIPQESIDEIKKIFEVTGGYERFEKIEHFSKLKAKEMGYSENGDNYSEYINHIFTTNNGKHNRQ